MEFVRVKERWGWKCYGGAATCPRVPHWPLLVPTPQPGSLSPEESIDGPVWAVRASCRRQVCGGPHIVFHGFGGLGDPVGDLEFCLACGTL